MIVKLVAENHTGKGLFYDITCGKTGESTKNREFGCVHHLWANHELGNTSHSTNGKYDIFTTSVSRVL